MFDYINTLQTSREKRFFIERIKLFIKLINVFKLKSNLVHSILDSEISDATVQRLIELRIIEPGSENDQKLLQKILKTTVYKEFIAAINFNVKYKKLIGGLLTKLDPSIRKIIQEKAQTKTGPHLIDFFCGAGGLSLGFCQEGFQIDLANDFEDVCVETYKYNHPEVPDEKVILGDIREIVDHIDEHIQNEIDVVVGGPPCQGYSTANQQRIIDDPRNELYKYYLKAIVKIAPKFVVMENVKGMLPFAKQVIEDYEDIVVKKGRKTYSYSVDCKVLTSSDFGVAQKRQRLIFIAIRNDVSKKNKITPLALFQEIENTYSKNKRHVLKDARDYIKPLEAPRVKNMTEIDDEKTGKKIDINQFNGNENSYLKLINEGRKIEYTFNHKARYTNDINYEIYSTLEQGEDGTNEKIKHVMPYKHRNHIFKDKYFKLIENKPSRTITAHLKMDCHSHIHPRQVRSITPREAARIQSFPDDYVFLGAYLKTYMQIGNAVPPVMARGIAKALKKYV